jgi:hypothetical protein
MCESLSALRQAASELVAGFVPATVELGRLHQVIDDAAAIEKMMATMAAMAASRLAGTGPARSARAQAVRELAKASGTSLRQAGEALEAAGALGAQPELDAAARAGELSRQQLALVAATARSAPDATGELLALARAGSVGELAEGAARARAAGKDLAALEQQAHARRGLRAWTGQDGAWHLYATGRADQGARLMAAIRPFAEEAFRAARRAGRRERPEAYAFDGLVALASAGGGGSPRAEVLVRADLDALLRGYPVDGEVCELAGAGPVSAQAVYDMMASGSAFLKGIVTKGKDVASVAHFSRRPSAHQQSALDWLFPTCAAEGCGTRAEHCETDHRVEWSKSRITLLSLLDRLCRLHHGLKTTQGWALVEGRGKRPFVAPQAPRHPRFRTGPPGTEPG